MQTDRNLRENRGFYRNRNLHMDFANSGKIKEKEKNNKSII